jgi:hypothetical protein
MAGLIAYYFPKMIDIHNYVPANSAALKKNNWEVLNRKVLPKLGIKLPNGTIEAICHAKPGYIEPVSDIRCEYIYKYAFWIYFYFYRFCVKLKN